MVKVILNILDLIMTVNIAEVTIILSSVLLQI